MTVAQLILTLHNFDLKANVLIEDKNYGGYHKATHAQVIQVVEDDTKFFDAEESGETPITAIIIL